MSSLFLAIQRLSEATVELIKTTRHRLGLSMELDLALSEHIDTAAQKSGGNDVKSMTCCLAPHCSPTLRVRCYKMMAIDENPMKSFYTSPGS